MKKSIYILCTKTILVVFLLQFSLNGRTQALNWSKTIVYDLTSQYATIYVTDQDYDPDFGYVITGYYSDTIDFDPSENVAILTNNAGPTVGFIAAYDIYGSFKWVQGFTELNIQNASQSSAIVKIDHSGNIVQRRYLANNSTSIILTKFTNNGNLLWEKTVPINYSNTGQVALDTDGNIYLTGDFHQADGLVLGNVSIPPNPGPTLQSYLHFMLKIDPLGNNIWLKGLSTSSTTSGHLAPKSLSFSTDNKLLISLDASFGIFDFNPSGSPSIVNTSFGNAAVSQIVDTSGAILNVGNYNATKSIATTNGDYYFLSYTPATLAVGSVTKINSNGIQQWNIPYFNANPVYLWDIQVDDQNNLFVSGGVYADSFDIDPGLGTRYVQDSNSFIATFNSSGDFLSDVVWPMSASGYGTFTFDNFDIGIDHSIYFHTPGNSVSHMTINNMSTDSCSYIIANSVLSVTAPSCTQNGQIILNPIGGIAPYTYSWSAGATGSDTATFTSGGMYQVTVQEAGGCKDSVQFLINAPTVSCSDIGVTAVQLSGSFIPWQSSSLLFEAKNYGCTPASGSMFIVLDTLVSSFSSLPAPNIVHGDTLVFHFSSLIYNTNSFNVHLDMLIDSNAVTGSPLNISLFTDTIACDTILGNNSFLFNSTVNTSFDPNDITVYPNGKCNEGYIAPDQKLTYTVRFQNTGTAPAIHVKILDSLDANLNFATIRVLASSHDMYTQVLPGNVLRFVFNNINLPDSNTNEPASHGYVVFEIEPIANLLTGIEIENSVGIYFDFNAPVYTNTVKNTIYNGNLNDLSCFLTLEEKESSTKLVLYPNPAKDILIISNPNLLDESVHVQITDINRRIVLQSVLESGEINISELNEGCYFISVPTTIGTLSSKFIKL